MWYDFLTMHYYTHYYADMLTFLSENAFRFRFVPSYQNVPSSGQPASQDNISAVSLPSLFLFYHQSSAHSSANRQKT